MLEASRQIPFALRCHWIAVTFGATLSRVLDAESDEVKPILGVCVWHWIKITHSPLLAKKKKQEKKAH